MGITLRVAITCIVLSATTYILADDFSLIGTKVKIVDSKNKQVVDESLIKYTQAPADAVAYALVDASKLSVAEQPFQRYIWIPDADKKKIGVVCYAVNLSLSKSSTLIRPQVVAQGHLVRIDLRNLAPRDSDFTKLLTLWEKLAFEPYFHLIRDSKEALPTNAVLLPGHSKDADGSSRFKVGDQTWFKTANGTTYLWEANQWIQREISNLQVKEIAVFGSHTGLEQAVMLQGLVQSNAAIVRYDHFLLKSLTTLDGGLYYEFLGVERNPQGKTAQQVFLDKFGGVSETRTAALRSDQRTAMFKSKVTGRPRRLDFMQGDASRPGVNSGLVMVTHDPSDAQVKAKNDPIRNLLEFEDAAREVICELPNGLHAFALFNSKGELQDSAPDNVVTDRTVPAPHTSRLQPAISCIRCHGPNDGLQPAPNEVQLLLSGLLDVFDDLSSKKAIPDTLDRLAGLYAGNLDKALRQARDNYTDAVFVVTNGMQVPETASVLSTIFNQYQYTEVDAAMACAELGYVVPQDKAALYLNVIVPPLQNDILGIRPEDPIIAALKSGLRVNRFQFEAIYGDMAFRAQQSRLARAKAKTAESGKK